MSSPTIPKDVGACMYPHICRGHGLSRGHDERLVVFTFVLDDGLASLSGFVFFELGDSERFKGGRELDTGELSSQVMLLLTKEEWVGVDGAL